jgi:alkylhydroperoxidase/carboxymuconolactone decarboxylase family protein YurZ
MKRTPSRPPKRSRPPRRYDEVKRRHPAVVRTYESFGNALRKAGPLTDREAALVRLGVAMGAGYDSAVKAHVRRGGDAGLSGEDLRHAALLGGTTIGFPSMMKNLSLVDEALSGKRRG